MYFLYIYKLKINVKLQEKTHVNPPCTYRVPSCVNIRSESFVFNVLISCNGLFKATKKSSLYISWNYQTYRVPVNKTQMIRDFFELVDCILIIIF